MNVETLTKWLAAIGVPPEVVSVDVEADNTWCLLRTKRIVRASDLEDPRREPVAQEPRPDAAPPQDPQQQRPEPDDETIIVAWEVFWREQGNRYDWASFTNEQVACHYLFGRLAWSQVVRGAVGVIPVAAETQGS